MLVYFIGVLSILGFTILALGEGFLMLQIFNMVKHSQAFKGYVPKKIKYLSTGDYNKDLEANFAYGEPSCFDIEAAVDVTIPPLGRALIETGLVFDLPKELEIQIRPRSGYTYREGNMAILGTIDSDYRGSFKVNCFNLSDKDIHIKAGDRIAQGFIGEKAFIFGRDSLIRVNEIEEFNRPITSRGEKGFGSSGMKKRS